MQEKADMTVIEEIKQFAKIHLRHIERELFKNRIVISLLYALTAVLAVLTVCFVLDKNYTSVLVLLLYVLFIVLWISHIEKERQKLMEKKYVFLFLNNIPAASFQAHTMESEDEHEP